MSVGREEQGLVQDSVVTDWMRCVLKGSGTANF